MRTQLIFALVLAGAAVSTAADAQSLQPPRPRQGYYVSLGMLGNVQHVREDGQGLGRWSGFGNTLRLGQLLTSRIGVGLLIDVGGAEGSHQASTLVGVGVEGHYEVAPNLALRAGVGLGVIALDDLREDDEALRGVYCSAYTVGVTYDWFFTNLRRTGGWAITPVVQARWMPGGDVSAVAGFLGIEVSYWTGLPKNQLELSVSEAFR